MSTPADATRHADDGARRKALDRLAEQLDDALPDAPITRTEVGEARREGRRVVVPVAVEVAEDDEEAGNAEQKSWSEEDPEGFEEAVEYLLDKNRELLHRLA